MTGLGAHMAVAALGMTQQRLLPGDLHWIIRVLHLVVGVASMPLAAMLTVGLELEPKPA